jgi:hypothetical protein
MPLLLPPVTAVVGPWPTGDDLGCSGAEDVDVGRRQIANSLLAHTSR